ncbi:MAG: hypothetical protein IAE81_11760 [Caldilineaceae bacterium]|nr:hypothetical protein [Caldilineaceae bacterium]
MRHIARQPLDAATLAALAQRQRDVNDRRLAGTLNVAKAWSNARKTAPLLTILETLKAMMGAHERCMYCHDSHGADIEHFWPKRPYPERMFAWPNLLLCCPECNRFKGDDLPLENGSPLLIDPTSEEPWDYLDFDPITGNIVARFELERDGWSPKGETTVKLLQLDRREALAAGYRRTYLRLSALVTRYLAAPDGGTDLPAQLFAHDDHGLLGWCLNGAGQTISPFADLRQQHPVIWHSCLAHLAAAQP